jgi:hypothetical protein
MREWYGGWRSSLMAKLDEEVWDLGIVGVVEMETVVGEAAFSFCLGSYKG